MQPGGFADALRQGHHPASVEQQHQREFQRPDGVEHAWRVIGSAVHQALSWCDLYAAHTELGKKSIRDRWCQQRGMAAIGKMQDSTILGYHTVDEVQVARHPADRVHPESDL